MVPPKAPLITAPRRLSLRKALNRSMSLRNANSGRCESVFHVPMTDLGSRTTIRSIDGVAALRLKLMLIVEEHLRFKRHQNSTRRRPDKVKQVEFEREEQWHNFERSGRGWSVDGAKWCLGLHLGHKAQRANRLQNWTGPSRRTWPESACKFGAPPTRRSPEFSVDSREGVWEW